MTDDLIHIVSVEPLPPYGLRLGLSDGRTIERDLTDLVSGPLVPGSVFLPLRDPAFFAQVQIDDTWGTVVWPNGVDLDPDVLIWGPTGAPVEDGAPHAATSH